LFDLSFLFILPGLKGRSAGMKTIREALLGIIADLDVIFETLKSLGKDMEATIPQVVVDEYYKILLATERLRESIRFLKEIAGETKNVSPIT